MFSIPYTFSNEDESYITIPVLKRFAKEKKNEDLKTTVDRPQLIQDIENYANQSTEKREEVLDWLDHVLVEGIKDVEIKYLDDCLNKDLLYEDEYLTSLLESLLYDKNNRHLNTGFSEELKLFRYDIDNEWEFGRRIRFYTGKLLCSYDKKHGASVIPYPICVELYLDSDLIVARAKSKSGLYKYMENFELEKAYATKAEKQMADAIKWVCQILSLQIKQNYEASNLFRTQLYLMLEQYTDTPQEIVQLIDEKKSEIENMTNCLMDDICSLPYRYREDVKSNILNMVEKYFSISYKDKSIFTKNRDAYPLRLNATDEEESKVEQTAALEEPLQSKAIFFDNKKMLQKSKMCDGVTFMFKRQNTRYFNRQFKVKIYINKNYCTLKFTEYTMEEDIVHVLFSLIDAKGLVESGAN